MGKVFKGVCVDERTGVSRPVAIKFMFDDLPANAYERRQGVRLRYSCATTTSWRCSDS